MSRCLLGILSSSINHSFPCWQTEVPAGSRTQGVWGPSSVPGTGSRAGRQKQHVRVDGLQPSPLRCGGGCATGSLWGIPWHKTQCQSDHSASQITGHHKCVCTGINAAQLRGSAERRQVFDTVLSTVRPYSREAVCRT